MGEHGDIKLDSAAAFQAVYTGSIPVTRSRTPDLISVVATAMPLPDRLGLRPDDVRVEGGKNVLKVRGKGDRERLVPLSPSLARRLKRFGDRARGEASSDRLFLTLRRGRESGKLDAIIESAVEQMIRALGEVAGIKKRSWRGVNCASLPSRPIGSSSFIGGSMQLAAMSESR
jgi:integrase